MKSLVSASVLLAGLALASPAIAQTANLAAPQLHGIACDRQQQAKLPPGRTVDPPADPPGTGPGFDPYPAGYGLYSSGND